MARAGGAVLWEAEVCGRIVAGDERALEELYDQLGSWVFGLAACVTGNVRAAEDVTNDVFGQLWRRPEAFDPSSGSLRSWLGGLAHRRAVEWLRASGDADPLSTSLREEPVAAPDVDEVVDALVRAERVRAAAAGLPDDLRSLVTMTWSGGRTYREVAHDLAIDAEVVKARLRRAVRLIADALDDDRSGSWA